MFSTRNRLLSLIIRILGFVTLSTIYAFYLGSINDLFWLARYEIQAGFIYIIVLGFEIIFNLISLRYGVLGYPGGVYMPLKLGVTLYVLLSTFLHMVIPFSTLEGEKTLIAGVYSVLFFLFALADWIFFDEKGTVKYHNAFWYLIYPMFYLIFNVFRPYIFGFSAIYRDGTTFPYGYLNPENNTAVVGIILSFLVILALGLIMIFINDLLSGKYKKRVQDY